MHLAHRISELSKYLLKGKSKYYLHSPFIYQFAEEILSDNRHFYAFDDIEAVRKILLKDNRNIEVHDFGAGRQSQSSKRKISQIAKKAGIANRYGRLLFRLTNHFKPSNMLELGTSLGLSSLYQSKGNPNVSLISIEGCPNIAQIALENMQRLNANVHIIKGDFDSCLEEVLQSYESLSYVYFDGNHQKEPTLKYFEQCLSKRTEDSIFVFDDIHWSPDMSEAWNTIKAHPKVTISIDLFQLGIVFFKKDQAKQDFILWYW